MKVLFIYLDINIDPNYKGYGYIGLSYLSAALKKHGFKTSLLHILSLTSLNEIVSKVQAERPDVIAYTATTNIAPFVKQWAGPIKELLGVPTIFGGVHASLKPQECIEFDGIDMVCVGEGEEPLLDVCRRIRDGNLDMSDIPNIWSIQDGKIYKNNPRSLTSDLDEIHFPDPELYRDISTDVYTIITSRGCPFKCTYCFNVAYRKIVAADGPYVRFRSPENVIKELKWALDMNPSIKMIQFLDDILPLRKKQFRDLCHLYAKEINLPYMASVRPELINEENAQLFKDSNCYEIYIGIESADEYIRNKILKRNLTLKQIENAFSLCHKHNIRTVSYNIVGSPFEGKEAIMSTLKLNARLNIKTIKASLFYPFPGTELEKICRDNSLIEKEWNMDYFTDSLLNFDRGMKEFIYFIRRFFIPIARFYSKLYKLPPQLSNITIAAADKIVMNSTFCAAVNRLKETYAKVRQIRRALWR